MEKMEQMEAAKGLTEKALMEKILTEKVLTEKILTEQTEKINHEQQLIRSLVCYRFFKHFPRKGDCLVLQDKNA